MNKKMYLLTTRPIDDALKDCKILRKKGVNAIASPSMGIIKNKLTLKSRYDGVFLTSRNAAHIIKILDNKEIPVFCVGSSTAKLSRFYGAKNVIVGNSDALFLANQIKDYLPKNSNIIWPSNNELKDNVYKSIQADIINIDKKIIYSNYSLERIDHDSHSLITKKQVSVILFFSLKSAEMWIELINKSNLFKFLENVYFVGINDLIIKYLNDLCLSNLFLSRRKRRASVISKGIKIFNELEKSL